MKRCRLIISGPGTGPGNMALDEAIFLARIREPGASSTFRFYSWEHPCMTIGYFQKHAEFAGSNAPVVRRLTGGLSVLHAHDLSYGFITSETDWPFVRDTNASYGAVHRAIHEALRRAGTETGFFKPGEGGDTVRAGKGVCVETVFPYDLHDTEGRKVLGSCLRRRGPVLLQQGSIHLDLKGKRKESFIRHFKDAFSALFDFEIIESEPEADELSGMAELAREKYDSPDWNRKF